MSVAKKGSARVRLPLPPRADRGVFGGICSAISAAGALLSYLKETQMHSLKNITQISFEQSKEFMELDINAVRNLELVRTLRDGKKYGSLLWVLDKTKTSMGARMLQSWVLSPLQDIAAIEYRLGGVEELYKNAGLEPKAIADAVLYAISQPENVDISDMAVRPIKES